MTTSQIRRSSYGITLVEALVMVAIITLAAAILLPVVIYPHYRRGSAHRASCQNNLKQVGLAFQQYVMDWNDQFPCVRINDMLTNHSLYAPPQAHNSRLVSPFGWADAVQPYIKNHQVYQCPAENHKENATPLEAGYTDYWYNRNLSGRLQEVITNSAATILCGDGNDGNDLTNARYNRNEIPMTWLQFNSGKPGSRHMNGANYAFADGHVKWLDQHVPPFGSGPPYTFALKEPDPELQRTVQP